MIFEPVAAADIAEPTIGARPVDGLLRFDGHGALLLDGATVDLVTATAASFDGAGSARGGGRGCARRSTLRWISFVPAQIERRLVVEPRPLPRAVARVVVGAAPQRRGGPEHRHRGVVQALAHLAPPQLVDAADRARAPRPWRCARSSASCAAGTSAPRRTPPRAAARGGGRRTRRSRSRAAAAPRRAGRGSTSWRGFTPRSWVSVEFATRQPSFSGPMSRSSGTNTSAKNTSLNSDSSVIWRSGRTSTPGVAHVDDEVRDALVLRRVGIGAGEAHAPVGELRVARPHLLAVEQPAAVDPRRRASSG